MMVEPALPCPAIAGAADKSATTRASKANARVFLRM